MGALKAYLSGAAGWIAAVLGAVVAALVGGWVAHRRGVAAGKTNERARQAVESNAALSEALTRDSEQDRLEMLSRQIAAQRAWEAAEAHATIERERELLMRRPGISEEDLLMWESAIRKLRDDN